MTDKSIRLPDARTLAYTLYGPANGIPVIYFHGTPSSRLEPALINAFDNDIEALLGHCDIQLIAVDRPGIGESSYNPNGDFGSFAQDVYYLAQQLSVAKCDVLCWSGGGPFALAMAHKFPMMVERVYIISGFAVNFSKPGVFKKMHANKYYFAACKNFPTIMCWALNIFLKGGAVMSIPQLIWKMPQVDHNLLRPKSRVKQVARTTAKEACRKGSRGTVHEAGLYFKDFGFKLKDTQQPVHFWWGNEDTAVTRMHAEAVETQVPKAFLHYKEGEGHLSIYTNYLKEVLETIASSARVADLSTAPK